MHTAGHLHRKAFTLIELLVVIAIIAISDKDPSLMPSRARRAVERGLALQGFGLAIIDCPWTIRDGCD